MSLEFPAELRTGNAAIDEQHEGIVTSLRQMLLNTNRGRGPEELEMFMESVTKYVQVHFQMEEELMRSHQYPDLEEHKAQHSLFLLDWMELSLWYLGPQGGDNFFTVVRVVAKVGEWLKEHILKNDMAMAEWIREKDADIASKSSSPAT